MLYNLLFCILKVEKIKVKFPVKFRSIIRGSVEEPSPIFYHQKAKEEKEFAATILTAGYFITTSTAAGILSNPTSENTQIANSIFTDQYLQFLTMVNNFNTKQIKYKPLLPAPSSLPAESYASGVQEIERRYGWSTFLA